MILKGKKILLAEDDQMLRECAKDGLEFLGASVSEAENGVIAFEMSKGEAFDAIVTDVRMPGGNGIELLDNIRKRDTTQPVVIFLTGFSDISLAESYSKGASAVFSKPYDIDAVGQAIVSLLQTPQQKWTRLHTRVPHETDVKIQFKDLASAIQSKTINLGNGGLFVAWRGPFPKLSEIVGFELVLSESNTKVEGSGIVRWVRINDGPEGPAGFGIEFESLAPESVDVITKCLSQLLTVAHIPKS